MKISDLARELNVSASQLAEQIKQLGFKDAGIFTEIEAKYVSDLKKVFSGKLATDNFKSLHNIGGKKAAGRVPKKSDEDFAEAKTTVSEEKEAAVKKKATSSEEKEAPVKKKATGSEEKTAAENKSEKPKSRIRKSKKDTEEASATEKKEVTKSSSAGEILSKSLPKADSLPGGIAADTELLDVKKPSPLRKKGTVKAETASAKTETKSTDADSLSASQSPDAQTSKALKDDKYVKADSKKSDSVVPAEVTSGSIIKRILKKEINTTEDSTGERKLKKTLTVKHPDAVVEDEASKLKSLKKEKQKYSPSRSYFREDEEEKDDEILVNTDSVIIKRHLKKAHRREEVKKEKHTFNPRRKDIIIGNSVSVGELAGLTGIGVATLIKSLMQLGQMVTINQYIDGETAQLITSEHGVEITVRETNAETALMVEEDPPETLEKRPPVVTIMGHVDHGKTSLLDFIRKTNVISGEAGGITQHIGAYYVKHDSGHICFLDTPGHEAFSQMRSRGANCTDIVILVVAADDGPMPQTVEAISHAQAAGVPIIVAVNKCDKPDADPHRTMQKLMEHGLVSEEFGGDVTMVKISAKKGDGVAQLMDIINLQADLLELKANPNRFAEGVVVESKIDKGRGIVATCLIQKGTLQKGDYLVIGTEFGRVRALINDHGKQVDVATPSMPVEILGLNGLPKAGDKFQVSADERTVRSAAEARKFTEKQAESHRKQKIHMDNFFTGIEEGKKNIMNLIIKADVIGSVEAISESLLRIGNDKVGINILHASVGSVSNSDVTLAAASNAIIIAFNVRPDANAKKVAHEEDVEIKQYSIIYNVIDDVRKALEGMLEPIIREEYIGRAEVLNVFNITGFGVIAGCKITEGKAMKDARVRVLRDNIVIKESTIKSLRRFKDDVKEVNEGFECGIGLDNYKDIIEKDGLEFFRRFEEVAKL